MIKRNKPHVIIELRLVTYRFQLDLYDYTLATPDGQGVIHRMECHDYASDKSICDRAAQIGEAIIQTVRKVN